MFTPLTIRIVNDGFGLEKFRSTDYDMGAWAVVKYYGGYIGTILIDDINGLIDLNVNGDPVLTFPEEPAMIKYHLGTLQISPLDRHDEAVSIGSEICVLKREGGNLLIFAS